MGIELDIVRLFDSNLRGFYTINTIARKLNKAYPFIHRKVHALIKLGVLHSVQVGKSHCCTINLKSRRAVLYLTELELEKRAKLPSSVQVHAKDLERDGTLSIETAVYANDQLYVVGTGAYPGATTLSSEEFKKLLLTSPVFSNHTVLHGYERFFAYLASLQSELDSKYNPLVQVSA